MRHLKCPRWFGIQMIIGMTWTRLSWKILQGIWRRRMMMMKMSQVVWDTDDNWDDLDKTIMEDFARHLEKKDDDEDDENDMEDMFK